MASPAFVCPSPADPYLGLAAGAGNTFEKNFVVSA
jgi:hypothetical protein